jgi:hypothetical protein
MFKCGKCGRTTVPNEKATRETVETREVKYECGSKGTEIVKEIVTCQQCAILKKQQAAESEDARCSPTKSALMTS